MDEVFESEGSSSEEFLQADDVEPVKLVDDLAKPLIFKIVFVGLDGRA